MTNEEIIEELLHEAEELDIRKEVLKLAKEMRLSDPKLSMVQSIEQSLNLLKRQL